MARASTTTDVFNAIGEAGRRSILAAIGPGELTVGDLVARVGLPQPAVSKHLRVLRDVDLVRCRTTGRHRRYRVNAAALRPVHEFTASFEALWNERYDRLDDLLHRLQEDDRP